MMSLKEAARSVLQIIDTGRYRVDGDEIEISAPQAHAEEHSRLYTPAELRRLPVVIPSTVPVVRVVDGTSQRIAAALAPAADRRQSSTPIRGRPVNWSRSSSVAGVTCSGSPGIKP